MCTGENKSCSSSRLFILSHFHVMNITRIKPPDLLTLVHAFITSQLDYYNALWQSNISPAVHTAAASKIKLHWLPWKWRITNFFFYLLTDLYPVRLLLHGNFWPRNLISQCHAAKSQVMIASSYNMTVSYNPCWVSAWKAFTIISCDFSNIAICCVAPAFFFFL